MKCKVMWGIDSLSFTVLITKLVLSNLSWGPLLFQIYSGKPDIDKKSDTGPHNICKVCKKNICSAASRHTHFNSLNNTFHYTVQYVQ